MEWLQTYAAWIVLIASISTAIVTIWTNVGKPASWAKKKSDKNFEAKVVAILEKVLPDMLVKHDLEVRDKYKADREQYLEDIKGEVLNSIQSELGAVSNLEEQYDNLQLQYETLAISARDVLREKIMAVYHKNKFRRQLDENEKEALDQYYKDYKKINGNSYIDKYYNRMKRWEVVPELYEYHDVDEVDEEIDGHESH